MSAQNKVSKEAMAAAVSAFARMGGQTKSEAKAAAARENGKKGGRPRKDYNGWKNRETWNVALYIQNTESLLHLAQHASLQKRTPYRALVQLLKAQGITQTGDGISYTSPKLSVQELNAMIKEMGR